MKQFSLLTATCLAVLILLCPPRASGQTANRPAASLFGHLDRSRIPGRLLWRMTRPDSATTAFDGRTDSVA